MMRTAAHTGASLLPALLRHLVERGRSAAANQLLYIVSQQQGGSSSVPRPGGVGAGGGFGGGSSCSTPTTCGGTAAGGAWAVGCSGGLGATRLLSTSAATLSAEPSQPVEPAAEGPSAAAVGHADAGPGSGGGSQRREEAGPTKAVQPAAARKLPSFNDLLAAERELLKGQAAPQLPAGTKARLSGVLKRFQISSRVRDR
jgi:hypothetical protein